VSICSWMDHLVARLIHSDAPIPETPSDEELAKARAAWRKEVHDGRNEKQKTIKNARDELRATDHALDVARDTVSLMETLRDKSRKKR
jgi:hypothetical protein